MKQRSKKQKKDEKHSLLSNALITGFIGGMFWSAIWSLSYYFNFSEVSPRHYFLNSWLESPWTDSWIGVFATILIAGVLSVPVALFYYIALKKLYSMWAGVLYGLLLWVVLFFLLQPLFPDTPPVMKMNADTNFTTVGLFMLFGTFIGYSISYDYYDLKLRQMETSKK